MEPAPHPGQSHAGTSPFRIQLQELLSEPEPACLLREQTTFDRLTSPTSGIVLYGAGGLGKKVLAALRENHTPPLAFLDNKHAGTTVEGIPVLSPAEGARQWGSTATFVLTTWSSWADPVLAQIAELQALGCRTVTSVIPLLWKFPALLPHTQIDRPTHVLRARHQVLEAFDLLSDEPSRQEFLAQIRWRLYGDFHALTPPLPDQYWQPDLLEQLPAFPVLLDGGAFHGDTLLSFLRFTSGQLNRAYLFEPDPVNLAQLGQTVASLPAHLQERIQVFPAAISSQPGELAFQTGAGLGSALGAGTIRVRTEALDSLSPLAHMPPHILKLDVEGAEPDALSGASRLIAHSTPTLIVCVYHLQDHLWSILLLIHSISPHYRFYLRTHGQIWETILYAIPTQPRP